MNTLTAVPESIQASSSKQSTAPPLDGESARVKDQSGRHEGLRLNGHAVIFSIATALALATAAECQSVTHRPSLIYGAVLWLWWACLASAMWKLSQRLPIASNFSAKAISIHLLVGSMLGVIHLLLLGSVGFTDPGWQTHASALSVWTSLLNINRFGMEVLLYGFLFGMIGTIQFQIRAQRDALKSMELQKQLSAAHLHALQMQLEPHFLFNTLNAITTLVEFGRQKEAVSMLSHLNAILRRTLQRTTPGESTPLARVGNNGKLSRHRAGPLRRPAAHRDQSGAGRSGWLGAVFPAPAHCGECHPARHCELRE